MYSLFNFEVIDRIFKERAEAKLSSKAKSLYINCLMGYFKGLEANEKNAMAFELFEEDIKNYEKWKTTFQELHKAKLITITSKMIVFNNCWGQFIDRQQLTNSTLAIYVETMKSAEDFRQNLLQNESMMSVMGMKNKIKIKQVLNLIDVFIMEQMAIGTKYANSSECIRHFINWSSKNIDKTTPVNEVVRSTGKILGR